jgi:anti-anti-sigma factor
MELQYSETAHGARVIKLKGTLDIVGVGQIETKFAGHCSGDNVLVIVDVAEVEFLASIGIRLLLLNAKSVGKRGGKMVLVAPTPDVGPCWN